MWSSFHPESEEQEVPKLEEQESAALKPRKKQAPKPKTIAEMILADIKAGKSLRSIARFYGLRYNEVVEIKRTSDK